MISVRSNHASEQHFGFSVVVCSTFVQIVGATTELKELSIATPFFCS